MRHRITGGSRQVLPGMAVAVSAPPVEIKPEPNLDLEPSTSKVEPCKVTNIFQFIFTRFMQTVSTLSFMCLHPRYLVKICNRH